MTLDQSSTVASHKNVMSSDVPIPPRSSSEAIFSGNLSLCTFCTSSSSPSSSSLEDRHEEDVLLVGSTSSRSTNSVLPTRRASCLQGHELTYSVSPLPTHTCDVCRFGLRVDGEHGRCSICDFDLCEGCAAVQATWTAPAHASIIRSASPEDGYVLSFSDGSFAARLGPGTRARALKVKPANVVLGHSFTFALTIPAGCGNDKQQQDLYLKASDAEERRRWIECVGELCPSPEEAISVADVGEYAGDFLKKVEGFNNVKNMFDDAGTTDELDKRASEFASFGPRDLCQDVDDLDELLRIAEKVKPVFDEMIRQLVLDAGIDPDEEYEFEDESVDEKKRYRAHATAPLKGEHRCKQKVANEYGGNCSRLVDVVRCTVVCATADSLLKIIALLMRPARRLKNRFAKGGEMATGYRDANFSVAIKVPGGGQTEHICEVQVHLAAILALKGEQHKFYEYFREYFKGAESAYTTRMALLRSFGESKKAPDDLGARKLTIEERIVDIVNGDDVESLMGLDTMCGHGMMGNYNLLVHVRRSLLRIEEGKDECDDVVVMRRVNDLGYAMNDAGDFAGAEKCYRRALDGYEHTLGAGHVNTLSSVSNLGSLLQDMGKLKEALPLARTALDGRERAFGASHPHTLSSVNNVGALLQEMGMFEDALPLYQRAIDGCERTFGLTHPHTLSAVTNLGSLLSKMGKLGDALPLYRRVLDGRERTLGADHPETLSSANSLAVYYRNFGQLVEAEDLFKRVLDARSRLFRPEHPSTLWTVAGVARLREKQGDLTVAEELFRRVSRGCETYYGAEHEEAVDAARDLSSFLERVGGQRKKGGCKLVLCFSSLLGLGSKNLRESTKIRIIDIFGITNSGSIPSQNPSQAKRKNSP